MVLFCITNEQHSLKGPILLCIPYSVLPTKNIISGGLALRISELIKTTDVPKQTIHHYLNNGLLPKPRKIGKNLAEYDQRHVDCIRLIKDLQEDYFLPLSVIKKILKKHQNDPESQALLKIRRDYFRPISQLLGGKIIGEDEFLKETGLRSERLQQYEGWGLITPEIVDGEKTYSLDDQMIGKIIDQWRQIGLTVEKGFTPELLRTNFDLFKKIIKSHSENFFKTALKNMTDEEMFDVSRTALEVTALFYYHLYRKAGAREIESVKQTLQSEKKKVIADKDIIEGDNARVSRSER